MVGCRLLARGVCSLPAETSLPAGIVEDVYLILFSL